MKRWLIDRKKKKPHLEPQQWSRNIFLQFSWDLKPDFGLPPGESSFPLMLKSRLTAALAQGLNESQLSVQPLSDLVRWFYSAAALLNPNTSAHFILRLETLYTTLTTLSQTNTAKLRKPVYFNTEDKYKKALFSAVCNWNQFKVVHTGAITEAAEGWCCRLLTDSSWCRKSSLCTRSQRRTCCSRMGSMSSSLK